MLAARRLSKRYGGLVAVDDVSFDIHPGEILGLLGPNGSGKSTTVNMIVGLLEPSSGAIALDGVTPADTGYRGRIGYVPEEPYLYTHLTAGEYLTLTGRLRGMPGPHVEEKISRLLRLFLLHDARHAVMSTFSKGMRQRVLLAAALLHNPELLVLDEPFSGLDVSAGLLFRALLARLACDGRMVLFSSHRFDVVEKVCSRVIILSRGRIVAHEHMPIDGRAASLEDLFARVTGQEDYSAAAVEILDAMRSV